jgi:large subunit ribosomal protein L10
LWPACERAIFMDKEQKATAVAELSDRLKEAESIFAVDYRGISVTGAAELRAKLREADASFKVVKNRLAKRAVEEAGTEGFDQLLEGPTALTFIKGDPVTAAKAISTFARENEVLVYKGGVMDGEPLDADGFAAIARLPGLDVLHGQLVGVTASPLTGLARGLGALMSGLAIALGQISEQGLVSGDEPKTEAPAEDEAAAEEETPGEEEAAEEPAADAEDAEPAPQEEAGEAAPPDEGAIETPSEEPGEEEAAEEPGSEETSEETSNEEEQ